MDVDQIDATQVPSADVQTLASPTVDPCSASDTLQQIIGERPTLVINLTDTPSPVIAMCGGVSAEAATADAAVQALSNAIASSLQDAAAVAATEQSLQPEPPTQEPVTP